MQDEIVKLNITMIMCCATCGKGGCQMKPKVDG